MTNIYNLGLLYSPTPFADRGHI